jgi:hypothetical protein
MKPAPFIARVLRHRRLWALSLEGLFALAASKLRVTLLPFRYWAWPRGRFQSESLRHPRAAELARITRIRHAVKLAGRVVPWRSKCLDQALATQRMLARRGLDSTLYYGMIRKPNREWAAHAWVRCGDQWAIGHHRDIAYAVVGTCAWIP